MATLFCYQPKLQEMLESGLKFLIFAHHKSMMNSLETLLREKRCGYMRIDGTTPSAERHEKVQRYQKEPDLQVALLSMTAAGIGITLTAAHTVVRILHTNPNPKP